MGTSQLCGELRTQPCEYAEVSDQFGPSDVTTIWAGELVSCGCVTLSYLVELSGLTEWPLCLGYILVMG